jgi:hypothetical protein
VLASHFVIAVWRAKATTELFISDKGDFFDNVFTMSGTSTDATIRFSASFTTLPDGGSAVALLGITLVGLEGLRRKLRAS